MNFGISGASKEKTLDSASLLGFDLLELPARAVLAFDEGVCFGEESQRFAVAASRVDLAFSAVDELTELAIEFLAFRQPIGAFGLQAAIGPEKLEWFLELLAVGLVELVADDCVARSDLVAERRIHFRFHSCWNVEVESLEGCVDEVASDIAHSSASVVPRRPPSEGVQGWAVGLLSGGSAFPDVPIESGRFFGRLEFQLFVLCLRCRCTLY